MKSFAIGAVIALGLTSGAAQAMTVGVILAQGSDGDIYKVTASLNGTVRSASATLFRDLNDANEGTCANPPCTNWINSPNGLGFSGNTAFRTTFGNGVTTFLRENTTFPGGATGLIPETSGNEVAAGHASGNTYYFATGNGQFGVINSIFGTPPTFGGFSPFVGTTWGDIAIRGDDVFASYDSNFARFSLTNILNGNYMTGAVIKNIGFRFAGLAFSGDTLFGFNADGGNTQPTNTLFSIVTATGATFGNRLSYGDITGLTDGMQITDAAPIPLPMGAWLMLTGLAGAVALRRRKAQAA